MDQERANPRRRRQFSLLNLVLITTVVALSVTVYLLDSEVGPLRQEVKRLRDEVGELHIEDKSKLHAIRVDTDNSLEWKWRVWVPEGTICKVRSTGDAIPAEGFPADGGTVYLREPGEHVLRWVVSRDEKNNRWVGEFRHSTGSVGYDQQPWVEWGRRFAREEGVGRKTQVFEPDERVVLIRRRYTNRDNPPANPDDPLEGFLIWIEP